MLAFYLGLIVGALAGVLFLGLLSLAAHEDGLQMEPVRRNKVIKLPSNPK